MSLAGVDGYFVIYDSYFWELFKPCKYDISVASNVFICILCVCNSINMVILKKRYL